MPSSISITLAVAALAGLSQLAYAQTNITANHCAASSEYSSCNRDVADKWGSCVNDCNGNGNCIVDCGCTAHQKYINCMAESCWNQVLFHPLPTRPSSRGSRTRQISPLTNRMLTWPAPPGILLRIPALRAAILCRLPQCSRANSLLACPERRPKPLLLRPRKGGSEQPLGTQFTSQLH